MEEVDREIFEDEMRNGEWYDTAQQDARRYADSQLRLLRKIDKTGDYSISVEQVGRHTWAAIIWKR
jgi:hypothetical protein